MDIKEDTVKGIITIGPSKILQQVIGLVVTAILANLLTPEDFGLVGMVTVFTGFAGLFTSLGLGSALIQKKDITTDQLSTIFWVGLIGGITITLIFSFLAYPISIFYKEPQLIKITLVLSLNFLISPLFLVNRKLLQRELRFYALALITTIAIFLSGLTAILAALSGFGIWSIVIQSISLELFYLALFQLVRKWFPKFVFDFKGCIKLIRFGLHMVGTRLTLYVEKNIDIVIIGKLLGPIELGYYTLAYRVMSFPIRRVSYTFNEVLFPVFSKVQDKLSKVQTGYLKSIRYASLLIFPIMMIVFLFAEDFVLIVFGEKWLPVALLLKILAPAGAIQSITQIGTSVFPALDKPHIRMRLGIVNCIFFSITVIIGTHWGIKGVAYAVLSSAIVNFYISQIFLNNLIKISFLSIINSLIVSILGCAVIFLVNYGFQFKSILLPNGDLSLFISCITIYLMIYFLYLVVFDSKDLVYLKSIFESLLTRNKNLYVTED